MRKKSTWLLMILFSAFSSPAAAVYDQGSLDYVKEIGSNPAVDRDCITPAVCLTRGLSGGLYNANTGNGLGLRWASGRIQDWATLSYDIPSMDGRAVFGRPMEQPFVLHIQAEDLYLEVTFRWWSVGRNGSGPPGMPNHGDQMAGFSYTRTTSATPLGPVITQHPAGLLAVFGYPVQLSVTAEGQAPLSYQWLRRGLPIPGAVTPTVSSASIRASDSGSYSVRVSNALGSVTSNPAQVSVWNGRVAQYPWSEDFRPNPVTSAWIPYPYWSGHTTNPSRSVLRVGTESAPGHCGAAAVRMGSTGSGSHNLNEAILKINLAGRSGVRLSFRHAVLDSFPATDEVMPDFFTGHSPGNGIAISTDGNSWRKIQGLNPSEGALRQVYRVFDLGLDSVTAAAGLTYTADFRIKLQQSGTHAAARNGHCFDDLSVGPAAPAPP